MGLHIQELVTTFTKVCMRVESRMREEEIKKEEEDESLVLSGRKILRGPGVEP
jgi:hypothetical protein